MSKKVNFDSKGNNHIVILGKLYKNNRLYLIR